MTLTTNLQCNNLQYLLTKKNQKTKPTTTKTKPQQNSLPPPPEINIEGTDVGREERLTSLP